MSKGKSESLYLKSLAFFNGFTGKFLTDMEKKGAVLMQSSISPFIYANRTLPSLLYYIFFTEYPFEVIFCSTPLCDRLDIYKWNLFF